MGALPKDFLYAIEVRNEELLQKKYFTLLNDNQVTHCFNHWTNMPPLKAQMKRAAAFGGLTASFFVSRILTPIGVSHQQAVKRFQPYDKLVEPQEHMRNDVVLLAKRALDRDVPAFVIINNRSEGNSPKTIDAIGKKIIFSM